MNVFYTQIDRLEELETQRVEDGQTNEQKTMIMGMLHTPLLNQNNNNNTKYKMVINTLSTTRLCEFAEPQLMLTAGPGMLPAGYQQGYPNAYGASGVPYQGYGM